MHFFIGKKCVEYEGMNISKKKVNTHDRDTKSLDLRCDNIIV
jgi:hypothetical protein